MLYSAEQGYNYLGDEYWPSFEQDTPHWNSDDRSKIQMWFSLFHEHFEGVKPSGRWANWFTIISWPITHAVLPRYLQRHFARALYDARHALFSAVSSEPTVVGQLIAAHSRHAPDRFVRFLEQEELVGRIALAVLDGEATPGDLLHPDTFRRIVRDLERVQESREWLQEAKYRVGDRFKGIASGTLGRRPRTVWPRREEDSKPASLRPRLVLRHRAGRKWLAAMEWPSFSDVARRSREHHEFLTQTRCSLQGVHGPRPSGWLLTGRRIAVLRSYPDPSLPLIRFERRHATIEHLVNAECRLTEPPWLFRIGEDGTAREIRGRVVRPNSAYILVAPTDDALPNEWADDCAIECEGVHAVRLTVPDPVTKVWGRRLRRLNLQPAGTIRVWPAGIPGRNWDGEGMSEWLTTEAPCIGLLGDYPVGSYEVSVNGATTVIPCSGNRNEATFVRLEPLPAGEYLLTVQARRDSDREVAVPSGPARGYLNISVRLPEAWGGGMLGHSGLRITCEPTNATLDQFWSNELDLTVQGPGERKVQLRCSLNNRTGNRILSKPVGKPTTLPVSPAMWRDKFRQFADQQRLRYSEATAGRLTVDGGELGEVFIEFERELLPLRWEARIGRRSTNLRLVDDTGSPSAPDVRFHSVESPLDVEPVTADAAYVGFEVGPPGGLFWVRKGVNTDAVAVEATGAVQTFSTFSELGVNPSFRALKTGAVSVTTAIHLLSSWHNARPLSPLAQLRRNDVARRLASAIQERVYGPSWTMASTRFEKAGTPENLNRLQSCLGPGSARFATALCAAYGAPPLDLAVRPRQYFAIAREHGISRDMRECEIAWAVATEPHKVETLFGGDSRRIEEWRTSRPAFLRGARLLALVQPAPELSGVGP